MNKLIPKYLFTVAFILCIMSFFSGIITVREKTRYNMDMTPYPVAAVRNTVEGVKISLGKQEVLIGKEYIESFGKKAFYGMLGDVFVKAGNFLEKNAS